ncbi:MAG TPA: glycoside hydrolase family 97 catalytic domain-containing protein, partial [Chitinophagaceae bacterium]|nr:glycoside hydrolase family 97 catalytic domain-containing protein [Chitinophagaceae bacterium]
MFRKNLLLALALLAASFLQAQPKKKSFSLASPDGTLLLHVETGPALTWSVSCAGTPVLEPSAISLQLQGGETWGPGSRILSSRLEKVSRRMAALHYKKDSVPDEYTQLVLQFNTRSGIEFRVYNQGVAYRFLSRRTDSLTISSEQAVFRFAGDPAAWVPYVNDPHNHDPFECSFENLYQHIPISSIPKDTLAFAPVLVDGPAGIRAAITEADLEDYPGMFLGAGAAPGSLEGRFAPYPLQEKQGGHNNLQSFVTRRADYLARTTGNRDFPWRLVIVSRQDRDLLDNDLVYLLASPSRVNDPAWIRPGKVAWDWWNDWNISHVNFRAGINTETYKYYIDFAAAHGIEYILLDEGWADSQDILRIVPSVDLRAIIAYGQSRNVGVWLWAGWLPLAKQMEQALAYYADLGVKGFKVDFMDRDDQRMVRFYYRLAAAAADHHLMLDFHGTFKPTGLQRTYPNVVNFEGVYGLEQLKWANPPMPDYDATIPFIRMLAGPMDYTPGAMRNATREAFR